MSHQEIHVPDIGDFKDVQIVEILVKVGESVKKDAPLVTLETDKATMEVPAPTAGVVVALRVAVGDRVSQGSPLLSLSGEASTAATAPVGPTAPVVAAPGVAAPGATPVLLAPTTTRAVRASPAVRKAARQQGIDLARVTPTALGGRVSRQDLESHGRPSAPSVNYAAFGAVERRPLSRIKVIAGANLTRAWNTIPHVTNLDEADITELEAFRATMNREQGKDGTKLTMLAFLIKASVAVLQRYPTFNASLDGDTLVCKRYFHIGFAADTDDGLVVPVIRDADQKGLLQIAREAAELASRAREGKLKATDMQGGCFTISSLGGIGGTGFTPIINAPEVAILGATRAQTKPVWDGTQFQPRLMLPLVLSWDHRVIDGAAAARFLVALAALLADFRRVSL